MPKSIHERVRIAQAKADKARQAAEYKAAEYKAAEYKAGESQRRSTAARFAAETRRDKRLDALITGEVEPRNAKEQDIVDRMNYGFGDAS